MTIKMSDENINPALQPLLTLASLQAENERLKREKFQIMALVNEMFSNDELSMEASFELQELVNKLKHNEVKPPVTEGEFWSSLESDIKKEPNND